MAANVGRQRRIELQRKARADALKAFLEPGWTINPALPAIVPVPTVLGHLQRGQQLLLRCSRPDCRRRCEVDLKSAVQAGFGESAVQELIPPHLCRHWNGCDLKEAMAIYPGGVPLVAYVSDDEHMIAIICRSCGQRWLITPLEAIRRLKMAGIGDGNTGVIALAKLLRRPCKGCGGRRYETTLERMGRALAPK